MKRTFVGCVALVALGCLVALPGCTKEVLSIPGLLDVLGPAAKSLDPPDRDNPDGGLILDGELDSRAHF